MLQEQSSIGIASDATELQQIDWSNQSESTKSLQNNGNQIKINLFTYFIFSASVLMLIFLVKLSTTQNQVLKQALSVQQRGMESQGRYLQQRKIRNVNQIKNSQLSLASLDHPTNTYHNHENFILPYQSIGMPKLGQSFNRQPILFQNYLSFQLLEEQLFKPHGNTDCDFQSYGSQSDKSVLCKNLIPNSQAFVQFGSSNGNSLGCSLSTKFKLKNLYYGCGCQKPVACNNPLSDYQQLCLSQIVQVSKQNVFTTLKNQIDQKGLAAKHIILKLDVGGAQWMALKTLPLEYLSYIDQLVIKFYNPKFPNLISPLKGYENIIRSLKQRFASVNVHLDNNQCIEDYQISKQYRKFKSTAIQVTLVNRRLLKINDDSRLYLTNFKNTISNIMKPDCQMNDND